METKSAFKSTEFWLTVATNVAVLLMALSEVLSPQYAALAMAGANALYAIARGFAKMGISPLGVPASVTQVNTGAVQTGVRVEDVQESMPPAQPTILTPR